MAHLSYDASNCAQECPIYCCDRKPLAETIVHSNGAVYTSLIDLTLYLLYMVRGVSFVLLDPPAKIQLKLVPIRINKITFYKLVSS